MKKEVIPLSMATPGKKITLVSVVGGRNLRARLTDMGLKEGMGFRVLHSHRQGPYIVLVGNTRLVLGHGMAQKILVTEI